jgi:hypothetical protein
MTTEEKEMKDNNDGSFIQEYTELDSEEKK